MCKSLVGRPINGYNSPAPLHQASSDSHAYITCIDGRYDRPPDDYGVRGVLPRTAVWDKRWAPQKPTAMFSFGADDGTYFGRLGGVFALQARRGFGTGDVPPDRRACETLRHLVAMALTPV